jgi:hypothetical protein
MHVTRSAGAAVLLAGPGVLLAAAMFFGGGSGSGAVWWLGISAVALLAGLLAVGWLGRLELPRPGRSAVMLLALAGGFVAWQGLSVLWSIAPDRSWDTFDKGIVLLAFLGLGLLASRGPEACRSAALLLAALLGAVLVWALLGKAIPALFPDGTRAPRLRNPVGYWNGLALLADLALPLALWLGTRRRAWAPAGALLVYLATATILLASSRTGVAAGLVAVGLWLWLGDRRVEGALLGLAGALPGVALAGWAFTRPALVEEGQTHADRVRDGAWFAVLAVLGGAVVVALVRWASGRELRRRREAGRALALGGAAVVLVGLVALVLAVGNPVSWGWDEFASERATGADPGRLASLGSNNRWQWWNEAVDVWQADPVSGAGAGTFELARRRYRENALPVTQPHDVPLQALADGGLVGLALFLGAVAAGIVVVVGALRGLRGEERAAAAALAVLPAVWLVHGLADYDLDFVAVSAPPLFALGVLAGAGRPGVVARRPFWALAAVAGALACIAVLVAPPLATRAVDSSTRALERRDFAAALDDADRAGSLNPFSLESLFARARAQWLGGDQPAALASFREAVSRQPDNPESWEQLGLYLYERHDLCQAYRALNEEYTLDPNGRQWEPGGPLDVAKAHVNAGRCS